MEIKKYSPASHKVKAVVYGPSGVGKTTFGATCPRPIFASAEGGLLSIASSAPDYVDVKRLEDLAGLLSYLQKGGHKYETVVIDSITEISEIIKADIEKRSGKGLTLQDFGTLGKKIKAILRGFRDLDMHVLFIALEKAERDEEGERSRIVKMVPDLSGKSAVEIAQFMDVVGYLTMDPVTLERKVITQSSAKLLTKDRTGMLKTDTTPNFSAWVEKATNIKVGKETTVHSDAEEEIAQEDVAQEEVQPVKATLKAVAKTEAAAGDLASKAQIEKVKAAWGDARLPANIRENRAKPEILAQLLKASTGRDAALENLTPTEAETAISDILERNATLIEEKPEPKKEAKPDPKAEAKPEAPAEKAPAAPVGKPVDNGHVQAIKDFLALLAVGMDDATKLKKLVGSFKVAAGVTVTGSTVDEVIASADAAARAKVKDFLAGKYNEKKTAA